MATKDEDRDKKMLEPRVPHSLPSFEEALIAMSKASEVNRPGAVGIESSSQAPAENQNSGWKRFDRPIHLPLSVAHETIALKKANERAYLARKAKESGANLAASDGTQKNENCGSHQALMPYNLAVKEGPPTTLLAPSSDLPAYSADFQPNPPSSVVPQFNHSLNNNFPGQGTGFFFLPATRMLNGWQPKTRMQHRSLMSCLVQASWIRTCFQSQ